MSHCRQHVLAGELDAEDRVTALPAPLRHLLETVRMAACRAETARELLQAPFRSEAGLRPDPAAGTLAVSLLRQSARARGRRRPSPAVTAPLPAGRRADADTGDTGLPLGRAGIKAPIHASASARSKTAHESLRPAHRPGHTVSLRSDASVLDTLRLPTFGIPRL